MKLITQEEIDASGKATALGGLKGSLLGLTTTSIGLFAAGKKFPAVARQPPVQKGWLLLVGTLLFGVTNAEFAYENHMRSQWEHENVNSLDLIKKEQSDKLKYESDLTFTEKALVYGKENRFKFIVASWFASMAGSGAYIWARNPTQTFSQKLVQARMAAQISTLAVLIATAGLSQVKVRGEENINGEKNKDDEWKYFVKVEEEREKREQEAKKASTTNKN